MLTRQFKLSYVAPSGLALWVIPFYVGASPYAALCRPVGAFHLIKNLGQLVYNYRVIIR